MQKIPTLFVRDPDDRKRRARRRALTRTIVVVLAVSVGVVLVMWAADVGGTSREECWAQGGSWMSTAHDCLLPPPST